MTQEPEPRRLSSPLRVGSQVTLVNGEVHTIERENAEGDFEAADSYYRWDAWGRIAHAAMGYDDNRYEIIRCVDANPQPMTDPLAVPACRYFKSRSNDSFWEFPPGNTSGIWRGPAHLIFKADDMRLQRLSLDPESWVETDAAGAPLVPEPVTCEPASADRRIPRYNLGSDGEGGVYEYLCNYDGDYCKRQDVEALERETGELRAALEDFAKHGTRCDLTPTLMFKADSQEEKDRQHIDQLYGWIRTMDEAVRRAAQTALAKL